MRPGGTREPIGGPNAPSIRRQHDRSPTVGNTNTNTNSDRDRDLATSASGKRPAADFGDRHRAWRQQRPSRADRIHAGADHGCAEDDHECEVPG